MSETVAARWEEYNEGGRRSVGLGQLAEAEALFRAAVREGELLGGDSPHLATSLNALGQLRLQARDLAEAESCFTRALSIRERTYGPDNHAIVPSLNNLSALHDAKGETDKAIELLRRSLAISDQALGGSHPEVALALTNLAKLYFKRRDFSKADRLLLRLLETKRALGRDHPEVATVLGSLAKLRQAVAKHGPAEQLWRQSLAIRERAFAPNDPIVATTLENVADCCAAQEGRLGDAIALRVRALAIRETAMGAAHPSIAAARTKLADLRARPGGGDVEAAAVVPPRTSQEVPSPLLSHEVPPYPAGQTAPTPDLPWIQLDAEPTGERPAAKLDVMGLDQGFAPPPTAPRANVPDRKGALTPRPPLVPPPVPPLPRVSRELVFTDSLAPEATPPEPRVPAPRPMRPQPPAARNGNDARPEQPVRRPPVRMPVEMAQSDSSSKKALLFALVLVALAGSGGWFVLFRNASGGAIVTEALSHRVAADRAPVARRDPVERNASGTTGGARIAAKPAAATHPATTLPATTRPAATQTRRAAATPERSDSTTSTTKAVRAAAAEKPPAPDVSLSAPIIPRDVEIDAVTNGIEQSTRSRLDSARLDSAQKARLEIKPVFKKP